ncbi:hypothetical protein [Microcoleus sp. K5-D4]|uniref:hypothetical protein n=1 Tax=Microcoleus sp. K5-D4 TaxID=2818801 RepID=UPI002FD232F7
MLQITEERAGSRGRSTWGGTWLTFGETFGERSVELLEIYSKDESGLLNKTLKFCTFRDRSPGLVSVFGVTTSLDRAILNPDIPYT